MISLRAWGNWRITSAQIQSASVNSTDLNSAVNLIRESQYFIEWTAPHMDIDQAAELVDLARLLSRWKLNWQKICLNPASLNQVSYDARVWSERVLDVARLLLE